ncbi:MAG: MFS transporter [Bacteroidaceae bacterium]|nr:MFS transporter [Bacteroidaceae bacterium]
MKKKNGKLTFTILSISLLTVMAGAAMAPALGVIRTHFADKSNLLVQLIVSLPALTIIITNLFFPLLCQMMRTKTIAVSGLLMYVVFGAGAFLVEDIWTILALRALLGVSVGMIMPLSTGLLSFYFPPEDQPRLMGLGAFMSQLGGVIATLLSGLLANISWNFAFLVYLLGLPALMLVALNLPNEKLKTGASTMDDAPDYYESETGITQARKKEGRPIASLMRFAPSVVGMYLQMLLFFIFPTNFAMTARANEALTGNDITLIMVGLDVVAAIVGIVFGWIMSNMSRTVKYMAPLTFIIGYAMFAIGVSTPLLLAGAFFVGLANGIGMPYLNTIASIKGGKDAATTVMPLISAAMYMGQFTSPLIVSPISEAIGSANAPYMVGVVISIVFLAQAFLSRKYQALRAI